MVLDSSVCVVVGRDRHRAKRDDAIACVREEAGGRKRKGQEGVVFRVRGRIPLVL